MADNLYAVDGRCHNAEPGTFGHECGKAATWLGTAASGFVSGFCDACKERGWEAGSVVKWERLQNPRYIPRLRPASACALPEGVRWDYVEAPSMYGIANRPDLPTSRHRYGVIETDRPLTERELFQFDLTPA